MELQKRKECNGLCPHCCSVIKEKKTDVYINEEVVDHYDGR